MHQATLVSSTLILEDSALNLNVEASVRTVEISNLTITLLEASTPNRTPTLTLDASTPTPNLILQASTLTLTLNLTPQAYKPTGLNPNAKPTSLKPNPNPTCLKSNPNPTRLQASTLTLTLQAST